MPVYQGPIRPGSDEQTFRDTGSSKIVQKIQGPVRPGDDEDTFRGGGGSHKKKRTPNPIHTPEAEKVIEASNKPQALQDKGSSAYVKQGGGVYTSTGKYYPTTNEKFVPQGYKEGFSDVQSNADFYNWKNGRLVKEKGTAVTVISNEDVPYAQSVEGGGVRINRPVYQEFNGRNDILQNNTFEVDGVSREPPKKNVLQKVDEFATNEIANTKAFYDKYNQKYREGDRSFETKAKNLLGSVTYSSQSILKSAVVETPKALYKVASNPLESTGFIFAKLKTPVATAKEVKGYYNEDPLGFLSRRSGELVASELLGGVAGSVVRGGKKVVVSKAKNPNVEFVGEVSESEGRFLATSKVGKDPIFSMTKVENLPQGQIGKEISFIRRNGKVMDISIRDVASVNEKLGGGRKYTPFGKEQLKGNTITNLPQSENVLSRGFGKVRAEGQFTKDSAPLLDTIDLNSIDSFLANTQVKKYVDQPMTRRTTASIIRSSNKEGYFDVVGTDSPVMRIYKSGKVSYGSKKSGFNILGKVRVKGSQSSEGTNVVMLEKGEGMIPLSQISEGIRQKAIQSVQPTLDKIESVAKNVERVSPVGTIAPMIQTVESKPTYVMSPILSNEVKQTQGQRTETSQLMSPMLSQEYSTLNKNRTGHILKSESQAQEKTDLFSQAQSQSQSQAQKQKQTMRQKQKNELVNKIRSIFFTRPVTPIPKTPITSSSKVAKAVKNVTKSYNVIGRKFGKNILLARNIPFNRARQLASKNVLSNLGRSFKLEESGFTNEADILFNLPSNVFRPSKRGGGWLVQKNALSNRAETGEIQMFRRSKSKRKRRMSWGF